MSGWVKLHRDILKWEWYDDSNTKILFFHLMIIANYEDKKWRGKKLLKGTVVTGYKKLGEETKLSTRQVRTAIEKLKMTGELTTKTSNQGTIIQLVNYKRFQEVTDEKSMKGQTDDKRMTNERQTDDKRMTTIKESKEEKERKEIKEGKEKKNEIMCLIKSKYLRLDKMKEPLTLNEAEKLQHDFELKDIEGIFMAMHNKTELLKSNISTNLTTRNWLSRQKVQKKQSESEKIDW